MTHASVIIIGSGPAGWTAAVYAARAGLAPVVIGGAIDAGGALMTTTDVENFPGFPDGIMGPELMDAMQRQAERFGAELVYDDAVSVTLDGEKKVIETASSGTYTADAVVLAMGSAYRKLGLPNEERLSGRGVSWCATCDGFFFKGKNLIVVGGGDSAMQEATFLTRFAEKVTIIHRRDELRASKIMADRALADPKIEIAWNTVVVDVLGEDKVTGVMLEDTVTGERREMPIDGMFVAIGHDPRSDLVKHLVTVNDEGYVLVGAELALGGHVSGPIAGTATGAPGIFAAGDLVDHVYRQAITAAGTGCAAALDAQHYLEDRADSA